MPNNRRLPKELVATIRDSKILGIRAGEEHRFIGIWAVVVEGRVFVRSWSLKPQSWYRTFLTDSRGTISIDGKEFPVRAAHPTSERLLAAIDRAYLEKYRTPGSVKYAKDLGRAKSKRTITELIPRQ